MDLVVKVQLIILAREKKRKSVKLQLQCALSIWEVMKGTSKSSGDFEVVRKGCEDTRERNNSSKGYASIREGGEPLYGGVSNRGSRSFGWSGGRSPGGEVAERQGGDGIGVQRVDRCREGIWMVWKDEWEWCRSGRSASVSVRGFRTTSKW